jgi:enterochelin esterase-like enzyme
MPVKIQNVQMTSPVMAHPVRFSIYIPPCYDDRITDGYPVIYLIHGQNMDNSVWQKMGLQDKMQDGFARMILPHFLVVTIQEDNFLEDIYLSKLDTAILETIIPWIDENYNTCTDRTCRAIGGYPAERYGQKNGFQQSGSFWISRTPQYSRHFF